MKFELDERLQKDCHALGRLRLSRVLLHRNAGVVWFILVPDTELTEIVDLSQSDQSQLLNEINQLSAVVREKFSVTRLNVAAIGNIVSQLHVHVVGRHEQDYCWPGVVWGTSCDEVYSEQQVADVVKALQSSLDEFVCGD